LIETHPQLIVVGSLTKILGIPGVRLGYLCAQDAEDLGANCLPWELNCFAEAIAVELPAHKREMLCDADENVLQRGLFTEGLRALGLYVYPSASNFILADLGRPATPVAAALKERHILVRECLDFEGLADGHYLRLAVKDEPSNVRFLTTLKEILCAENR
jgi:histidinol-phosphate/aromatic aminotransferase/cobyric acid decarboxylase-like protein